MMYIFNEHNYFVVTADEIENIIRQSFNRPDYNLRTLEPNLLPIEVIDFNDGIKETYRDRRQEVLNFADRYHSGSGLLPYLMVHLSVCKIIPSGRYLVFI